MNPGNGGDLESGGSLQKVPRLPLRRRLPAMRPFEDSQPLPPALRSHRISNSCDSVARPWLGHDHDGTKNSIWDVIWPLRTSIRSTSSVGILMPVIFDSMSTRQ